MVLSPYESFARSEGIGTLRFVFFLSSSALREWNSICSLFLRFTKSFMRKCLFCENPANSREHVWPEWILKRLNVTEPLHQKMGNDALQLLPNARQKVKAVCKTCNNGWMHALENTTIPIIGNLMHDVALSLDGLQQYKIATWAVKMAMVGDFIARSHRPLFFNQAEREQLRVATNLPARTSVWLARHSFPDHIGFWGTNSWTLDKTVEAFITTILVGHLAIQAVTLQCTEKWNNTELSVNAAPGPRPWPEMLTDIWPTKVSAQWPPEFSFKDKGEFSLLAFVRRYSYGENLLENPTPV
jgi:hypothetical protein